MPRTEMMRQYLKERKDEADYVGQFLEHDGFEKASSDAEIIPAFELYGKFKAFCLSNHIDKFLSIRNFISDLKRRGFIYTQRQHFGKTARVFFFRQV